MVMILDVESVDGIFKSVGETGQWKLDLKIFTTLPFNGLQEVSTF